MRKKKSDWQYRLDRTVAILGSSVPVALVLGVVAFEFFISFTGLVWLVSRIKFPVRFRDGIAGNILFWPILCWLVVVLVSRIFNGGTAYQFAHDFTFLRYPLFVTAMLDLSTRIPVHRYLIGGILVGIVYAGINLLSAHLIGHDFLGKPLSRYVGKLKEGQKIAAFCAYAAPFLLVWGIFDRHIDKQKRIWIVVIGCLSIYLLISCRIRTALLAALIGLVGGIVGQLVIRKHLKIRTVMAILFLGGLGAWWVLWMHPSMESLYDRFYYWKVSLQVWFQNPIIGVGISSFKDAYHQIAESGVVTPVVSPKGNIYQDSNPNHAHNLFLQLMVCNGILGLGIFTCIFLKILNIIRKSINSWHAGLWSWPFICIAIGLTGWDIYDPFYTTIVFYFLAFISVSVNADSEKQTT